MRGTPDSRPAKCMARGRDSRSCRHSWLDYLGRFKTILAARPHMSAQMVLVHGKIITVDIADSVAQAIAIRDGKILKVGTDADILALADPNTEIIDLKGRAATPGLIDTHAHIASGGLSELYEVPLSDATSVAAGNRTSEGRGGPRQAGSVGAR